MITHRVLRTYSSTSFHSITVFFPFFALLLIVFVGAYKSGIADLILVFIEFMRVSPTSGNGDPIAFHDPPTMSADCLTLPMPKGRGFSVR